MAQWFWIPEWNIEPGRTSRQQLIAFGACNLVVQRDHVELSGPTTRLSHQDLTGQGWAVGALLRPAAVPFFAGNPAELRDTQRELELPRLRAAVVHAMDGPGEAEGAGEAARRENAVTALATWLVEQIPEVSEEALAANKMVELIAGSAEVVRIEDAAKQLGFSTRTLQRLAQKYVGMSPSALIRRRRLQEAADLPRTRPDLDLATVAAEFGYVDQAHLANDFRKVLGFTPGNYRKSVGCAGD